MNGGDFRREIANPSIQTLLLTINLIVVLVGFGVIWGVQSTRIQVLSDAQAAEAAHAAQIEQRNVEHYQSLLSRMSALESDIKYMSQGIAELKLRK